MPELFLLSAIFVFCGLGITWKQAKAGACPVHHRIAGRIAIGLAVLSFVAAALTAFFAVSWG